MTDQPEEKTITNIYYDCLERIFDFLDLSSLLNVAGTCKRLQIAAAAKFRDEYGDRDITLNLENDSRFGEDAPDIEITEYRFLVRQKVCLPFLRCFGAQISHLSITYGETPGPQLDIVEQYINQYCADTLTSVKFNGNRIFSNRIFQKPFKNVNKVSILFNDLKDQLPNFVNSFPNLRHLKLIGAGLDAMAIEVSFPNLEHLEFRVKPILTIKNATKLLYANQQLKILNIISCKELTLTDLLNMINGNTSISKLTVELCCCSAVNTTMTELNRFASEHPVMIELDLGSYLLSVDDIIVFLGQLNSLKKFKCEVESRSEYDRLQNRIANEWQHELLTYGNIFEVKLNR